MINTQDYEKMYFNDLFQLSALAETLNEQVTKKGQEINEYKEKNNIRIRGQDEIPSAVNDENEQKSEAQPRNVIMVNPI